MFSYAYTRNVGFSVLTLEIGQQFALVETNYVIVRFLQECSRIEARDNGGPWTENLTLTCSVGQGVWVGLTKKDDPK
jgi:hypothetical protein